MTYKIESSLNYDNEGYIIAFIDNVVLLLMTTIKKNASYNMILEKKGKKIFTAILDFKRTTYYLEACHVNDEL